MEIVDRLSSSFGERRRGLAVSLIVLHYTGMSDAEAALTRLCNTEDEVSAHYLVAKDGTLYRMVDEKHRAWHAGEGSWAGHDDINSRSIGIELDNDGASRFAEPQMAALEELLADLLERHDLPAKSVIAHSDMAPDRKSDPGPYFDWQRLAAKGLSVWPEPSMRGDFMKDASYFGYPVEKGQTHILNAFRQRFRPFETGPLSVADESMMAGLARQYPADVTERTARRTPTRPLHEES
ncbi:MAG: N-acetylmuramoyl-L-alanine amidase [Silicimonas sp.]|jgi:N-acetylmuramoyl-L-alanine amidase|nr:N-acetylmuramoyl-L-alanine amidase [Silicimonas sp.]